MGGRESSKMFMLTSSLLRLRRWIMEVTCFFQDSRSSKVSLQTSQMKLLEIVAFAADDNEAAISSAFDAFSDVLDAIFALRD